MAIKILSSKKSQPGNEATEVVTGCGEDGVVGVAVASGETVAADSALLLGMADDGLDGGAPFHLSFHGRRPPRDASPRRVDFELIPGRRIVAAVTGIGVAPSIVLPTSCSIAWKIGRPRVAIIGIARQRCDWATNWPPAALEGGGNADLDAELVRLVRLALADALHLGRVQAA